MKFPEIPTDNLYKFMAFSGIVIIIVSFVPFFLQNKLRIQSIQFAGEKLLLYNQRESLIKKSKKALKNWDSIMQKLRKMDEIYKQQISAKRITMKEFKMLSDEFENLDSSVSESAEESEELADEFNQLKALTIQIAVKESELKYINSIIIKGLRLFHFGALSGLILTVIGFSLWYKKLQVPLDMTIKNKLKDEQKQ